jgi:hypothetical protein
MTIICWPESLDKAVYDHEGVGYLWKELSIELLTRIVESHPEGNMVSSLGNHYVSQSDFFHLTVDFSFQVKLHGTNYGFLHVEYFELEAITEDMAHPLVVVD